MPPPTLSETRSPSAVNLKLAQPDLVNVLLSARPETVEDQGRLIDMLRLSLETCPPDRRPALINLIGRMQEGGTLLEAVMERTDPVLMAWLEARQRQDRYRTIFGPDRMALLHRLLSDREAMP